MDTKLSVQFWPPVHIRAILSHVFQYLVTMKSLNKFLDRIRQCVKSTIEDTVIISVWCFVHSRALIIGHNSDRREIWLRADKNWTLDTLQSYALPTDGNHLVTEPSVIWMKCAWHWLLCMTYLWRDQHTCALATIHNQNRREVWRNQEE